MIDSQGVLYSAGKNDECYTPSYGVRPLLEFMPRFSGKTVWCPFDTAESEFVRVLRGGGYRVVNSHISDGRDFYEWEPKEWDLIVSNPPFTNKRKIFERCMALGKPFALLMSLTWLNDSAPKTVLGDEMQLLMFDKRIEFAGAGKITFSSAYFCRNFLPRQIVCRRLERGIS